MHTLELIVANHPGVMSHVCGLFARRALPGDFSLPLLPCPPATTPAISETWQRG
jgi:acetolactate synthase-1/3 small subunit